MTQPSCDKPAMAEPHPVAPRHARRSLPGRARTREERQYLVDGLMDARRAVTAARRSSEAAALRQARAQVNAAKLALGERDPLWWTDGAPDLNRRLVCNTPYPNWFAERTGKAGPGDPAPN